MEVPARFLKFSPTHRGVTSEEGWLEIDIRAIDLDGLTKLYVNLSDVARIRRKREDAASALDAWEAAFGSKDSEADDS